MGIFQDRPSEGGFTGNVGDPHRTCQHSSGCTKPVTKVSYCDEHYARCYRKVPKKHGGLPFAAGAPQRQFNK